MNKIKSRYSLRRFDLPESFNQSDVIVEIPFEFGYVKYFPYYNEAEVVVDLDKLSKFEKIRITNPVIPHQLGKH